MKMIVAVIQPYKLDNVFDLENAMRIRTGEAGDEAL